MTSFTQPRERGGCLTVWLVVSAVLSIVVLLGLIGLGANTDNLFNSVVIVGVIIVAADLAFIYGIWNWKRWGVYGLAVATVLSNGFSILNGIRPETNLVQMVVQLVILYYLVHSRWDQFE